MLEFLKRTISRIFLTKNNVKLIVLGHQKSGTTAIAALLSKLSDMEMSNDPLYEIDYGLGCAAEELIINKKTLDDYSVHHPSLFRQKIIKDPDFIFLYEELKRYYGNVKIVFVVRDPRDMIRSICNRLDIPGNCASDAVTIQGLPKGNRHWELILSGKLQNGQKVNDPNNYILNLASRWNLATQNYLQNKEDMLLVRYEDFLVDKKNIITDIASQLDIPCKNNIEKFLDIQYQPKGRPNIKWLDFFGEKNLHTIEETCEEFMSIFDYKK